MTPTSTFSLKAGLLLEEVDDEAVLLDPAEDAYFSINEVGVCIVRAIEDGENLIQIKKRVCDVFEIDAETASIDTEEFMQQLIDTDLLVSE